MGDHKPHTGTTLTSSRDDGSNTTRLSAIHAQYCATVPADDGAPPRAEPVNRAARRGLHSAWSRPASRRLPLACRPNQQVHGRVSTGRRRAYPLVVTLRRLRITGFVVLLVVATGCLNTNSSESTPSGSGSSLAHEIEAAVTRGGPPLPSRNKSTVSNVHCAVTPVHGNFAGLSAACTATVLVAGRGHHPQSNVRINVLLDPQGAVISVPCGDSDPRNPYCAAHFLSSSAWRATASTSSSSE